MKTQVSYYLSLIVILATVCFSSTTATATTEDLVRAYFSTTQGCSRNRYNPALSVSVVKDGDVVFADGFGHVDGTDDSSSRPTNTTVFAIASLTKAFTATLLVKLMEDAGIPLSTYLRDNSLFDNEYLFDKYEQRKYSTVKDALSHKLGFANNNFLRLGHTMDDIYTITKKLVKKAALGTSFYYNNLIYGLMTELTEKLGSGATWEQLMQTHILDPLGMNDTHFARTADFANLDLARHVVDTEGQLYNVPYNFTRKWANCAGSGSIMSSGLDMAKWMNVFLHGGNTSTGQQIFSEQMMADLWYDENPIPSYSTNFILRPDAPVSFTQDVYLLGWKKGYYRGLETYWHTGSTWGSSSMVMLIPSKKLGVFIAMTGRDNLYRYRKTAVTHLADLYLGETPWLSSTDSCTFPAGYSMNRLYIDRDEAPTRSLTEYVGTYSNSLYGNISVTLHTDGSLYMSYGWVDFKLYPRTRDNEDDEFYMEGQDLLENVMNFSECVFSYDGSQITTLSMTKWEPSQVPVFDKL